MVCVVTVVEVRHNAVAAVSLIGLRNECVNPPLIAGYSSSKTEPPEPSNRVMFPAVAPLLMITSVIQRDSEARKQKKTVTLG